MADALRRAGRFEKAIAMAERGLAADPEDPLGRILTYIRSLAQVRDAIQHTCAEAFSQEWM